MVKKIEKIGAKFTQCRNRLDELYFIMQDGLDLLNFAEESYNNITRLGKPGQSLEFKSAFGSYHPTKEQAQKAILEAIISGKQELLCQKKEVFEIMDQLKELYDNIEKDLQD